MHRSGPFGLIESTKLPVIVMEAAKSQPCVPDHPRELKKFFDAVLFETGAIHARIYVKKNADRTPAPLLNLFYVFRQDGNPISGN